MSTVLLSAARVGGAAAARVGPFLARTAGSVAAAYAGTLVIGAILGPTVTRVEGPRSQRLRLQSGAEGTGVARVFGRARIPGQFIWTTNFRETQNIERVDVGGKGGGQQVETTEFVYSISFALGLCEGPIDGIGRIWADGRLTTLGASAVRLHRGTEDQEPDPFLEAVEGVGATPAFRGLAYLVIEDMPLTEYGNRIPQLTVEVIRTLDRDEPEALQNALQAVSLIPGSGEAALATTPIWRGGAPGEGIAENVHNAFAITDLQASLNSLETLAPNCRTVSLFVTWYGDDLRAGECRIEPRAENPFKRTEPRPWLVSGLGRGQVPIVSCIDGRPAFGGTPSDVSVVEAIRELKARGFTVIVHPFLMMDIPGDNALPDPYGGARQATFPWRGRVTATPAAGEPGTADKTAAARAQIDAFFGAAQASDFAVVDDQIVYSGADEWGFRRFILHYAHLAAAGGADGVLLGSEMRALTRLRDQANAFPAVEKFRSLASAVRSVVGSGMAITYAADWSEYFGHQPADGTGDVYFHLDPLWADADIDAVGIDYYMPLSDWREGSVHLDRAVADRIHDLDYLKSNVFGGEGYDWYYASDADREAQIHTPITDDAYGEPWVFRYKDLPNWWSNAHHDRPGGVRAASPTAWVPEEKPIWLMEAGTSALDKSSNQPNVFLDPKSSESQLPYFSIGARDDLIQRRYLEALLSVFADPTANPTSSVYSGPMVSVDRIFAYCWDARPFPDFPGREEVWSDGPNWTTGHWLNGRLERIALGSLVETLSTAPLAAPDLDALVTGYVLADPTPPRAALEPLASIYRFDVYERDGGLIARPRRAEADLSITEDDLAETGEARIIRARADADDLPERLKISFLDDGAEQRPGVAEAFAADIATGRTLSLDAPVVLDAAEAQARAASLLAETEAGRESARFSLPPTRLEVEPGDVVALDRDGLSRPLRILSIETTEILNIEAAGVSEEAEDVRPIGPARFDLSPAAPLFGPPAGAILDLPLLRDDSDPDAVYAAAFAAPWPGFVVVRRGVGGPVAARLFAQTSIGTLTSDLPPAGAGRWTGDALTVEAYGAPFVSRARAEVLEGANALAVRSQSGDWEVLQFETATLIAQNQWRLSGLLRGQRGTAPGLAQAGADVVALGPTLRTVDLAPDLFGAPVDWVFHPAKSTADGPSRRVLTETALGVARRPYAPAHLRIVPEGGGYRLDWIRRARIGGDSWGEAEPPLSEEVERYRIEVYDGASLVRSDETDAPGYDYLAALVSADFSGAPGVDARIDVRQISARFGPGLPATATFPI